MSGNQRPPRDIQMHGNAHAPTTSVRGLEFVGLGLVFGFGVEVWSLGIGFDVLGFGVWGLEETYAPVTTCKAVGLVGVEEDIKHHN